MALLVNNDDITVATSGKVTLNYATRAVTGSATTFTNFAEGDVVKKGDVIAQLDTLSVDGELEAANIRLENARLQANDNTPVEYAEASYATAFQEYQTEKELQRKGAATRQELERKRLAARQAELQVVRSKAQKEIGKRASEGCDPKRAPTRGLPGTRIGPARWQSSPRS